MSFDIATKKPSAKPCGCGSTTMAPAASCGCGKAACLVCQDPGFARPNFFAGQLLTEEDLQLLGNYVVAKNRLHNRALFGAGVVCGLEVVCDPCGNGHVIVRPGYALDCCGNDIVVTCPQELDINAMVRDLKLRLAGGADCGDPCAGTTGKTVASAANAAAAGQGKDRERDRDRHRYCLYIRYCEKPTDPVAPYASDTPCAPSSCEPTRIREGFRFELRCHETPEHPPSVLASILACLGDKTSLERVIQDAALLGAYGEHERHAVKALDRPMHPPQPDEFSAALKLHYEGLSKLWDGVAAFSSAPLDTGTEVSPVLGAVFCLGRDLAQLRVQTEEEQEILLRNPDVVADAEALLSGVTEKLAARVHHAYHSPLERAHADSLLAAVRALLPAQGPWNRTTGDRGTSPRVLRDPAILALAHGAVWGSDLRNAEADSLATIRNWLIDRLERIGTSTQCDLLCEVRRIHVPAPTTRRELDEEEASAFSNISKRLLCILQDVIRECVCNALNPPCAICDDPGVLLACMTVEKCHVHDICILERDFVISSASLRYWLPELGLIGRSIERWCCGGCEERRFEVSAPRQESDPLLRLLGSMMDETARPLFAMARSAFEQRKELTPTGTMRLPSLGSLFERDRPAAPSAESLAAALDATKARESEQRRQIEDLEKRLSENLGSISRMQVSHAELAHRLSALEKKLPARK